jgi:molybdate transport system substrate-binding protein
VTSADEVTVAAASNFLSPLQAIEVAFEASTGHAMRVSAGSTGQLYSQIRNGAPFDILLAADDVRTRLLVEDELGDAASVFTYAIGRLALWTTETDRAAGLALAPALASEFRWFAIAQPEVAPYGAAARQVLEALGAWDSIQTRLVRGQNIAQTFAMVETGNAELGLVALSQALTYDGAAAYVVVAQDLHDPIRQDAILLNRGQANPAAVALMQFLKSAAAREIIEASGYSAGDGGN